MEDKNTPEAKVLPNEYQTRRRLIKEFIEQLHDDERCDLFNCEKVFAWIGHLSSEACAQCEFDLSTNIECMLVDRIDVSVLDINNDIDLMFDEAEFRDYDLSRPCPYEY